jgi:hypothetical protein
VGSQKYDYRTAKAEFVRGSMSVRELARSHGVEDGKHSSWHLQAAKPDPATGLNWYEEREQLQLRSHDATVSKLAEYSAKRALREAEVYDHAIDLVDAAFLKAADDLHATKTVVRTDASGERYDVEEPVFRIQPKDVKDLIDRIAALFGRQTIGEAATEGARLNGNVNLNFDGNSAEGRDALAKLVGLAGSRPKPADGRAVERGPLPIAPSSSPD